jgi:membrane-associated phospholipid phosphatase
MRSSPFPSFITVLYTSGVLVLLTLAAVVTKGQDVLWINGKNSGFLDFFFGVITNLGDGVVFVPVLLGLLFVRFYYSIMGVAIWIGQGLICTIVKRGFFSHMDRPKAVLDNSLLHFVSDVQVHNNYSFPSGHTATIFCLAVFLSLIIRNRIATVLLFVTALLVGYSRIYLLQHFLMDVAAGAFVGSGTAFLLWTLFERNKMPPWMHGAVSIKPLFKPLKFSGSGQR